MNLTPLLLDLLRAGQTLIVPDPSQVDYAAADHAAGNYYTLKAQAAAASQAAAQQAELPQPFYDYPVSAPAVGTRSIDNAQSLALGPIDYIGAGLATYSAALTNLMDSSGVDAKYLGIVRYDLPGLLADVPGGIFGIVGPFQAYLDYKSGNNREAVSVSGATLGAISGAEFGAALGGGTPLELVTVPGGALVGTIIGSGAAQWVYDQGYQGLFKYVNRFESWSHISQNK